MEKIQKLWESVDFYAPEQEDLYLQSVLTYFEVATDRYKGCVAILGFTYPGFRTVYFESGYMTAEQTRLAYEAMVESRHETIRFGLL